VCLFPQFNHFDPSVFANPTQFVYDRFLTTDGSTKKFYSAAGTELRHAFIPFGGGSSMCPGRFFAVNEMKLLVLNLLARFEFAVDSNVPEPPVDLARLGLGMQQPLQDVPFRFRLRSIAA